MVAYTTEVEMEEGHGVHNTETITTPFSRLYLRNFPNDTGKEERI